MRLATVLLLTGALAAPIAVWAQKQPASREAVFRCKDERGQTHFGDSMPPACQGLDTEVLNDRGMLVREIPGTRTLEERRAREAAEKKLRQEQEARAQRDRMLIDTYLTIADIERLRDQRLDLLEAQFKVTQQNIQSLKERQTRINQQIARFKPYSDNPNAPALPDHLAEEMVNTVNGLRVYQETLSNNQREQKRLRSSFDSDIRRFKELKGLR